MANKTIDGWLVIDWKNETHRTRKSKPSASELGANELVAELDIDVTIPEVETATLPLQVEVPEPQVQSAELSALSAEELPDWTAVADERLADRDDDLEATEQAHEIASIVKKVVAETLLDAPGRPDPERVEEYVHQAVMADVEESVDPQEAK
jgi:hypothetical protein